MPWHRTASLFTPADGAERQIDADHPDILDVANLVDSHSQCACKPSIRASNPTIVPPGGCSQLDLKSLRTNTNNPRLE